MYAIIRAGGKQAKVREGDVFDVERIKHADTGITFTPLLIVKDDGTVISDRAQLDKAKVVAEVLGESRGEKIDIFKYKNKTGYRRHQGHRQTYTRLKVTGIEVPGAKKKAAPKKAKPAASAAAEETAADAADTATETGEED
jgi:large subunit ribosomal protein L21